MKKLALLVVLALCATACTTPASAQDLDQAAFNNAMITRSQIKHNTGGALDPLSVRSRYMKRKGRTSRTRKYRSVRGTRRYSTSRLSKSNRRTRTTYRTNRRTTMYRTRR